MEIVSKITIPRQETCGISAGIALRGEALKARMQRICITKEVQPLREEGKKGKFVADHLRTLNKGYDSEENFLHIATDIYEHLRLYDEFPTRVEKPKSLKDEHQCYFFQLPDKHQGRSLTALIADPLSKFVADCLTTRNTGLYSEIIFHSRLADIDFDEKLHRLIDELRTRVEKPKSLKDEHQGHSFQYLDMHQGRPVTALVASSLSKSNADCLTILNIDFSSETVFHSRLADIDENLHLLNEELLINTEEPKSSNDEHQCLDIVYWLSVLSNTSHFVIAFCMKSAIKAKCDPVPGTDIDDDVVDLHPPRKASENSRDLGNSEDGVPPSLPTEPSLDQDSQQQSNAHLPERGGTSTSSSVNAACKSGRGSDGVRSNAVKTNDTSPSDDSLCRRPVRDGSEGCSSETLRKLPYDADEQSKANETPQRSARSHSAEFTTDSQQFHDVKGIERLPLEDEESCISEKMALKLGIQLRVVSPEFQTKRERAESLGEGPVLNQREHADSFFDSQSSSSQQDVEPHDASSPSAAEPPVFPKGILPDKEPLLGSFQEHFRAFSEKRIAPPEPTLVYPFPPTSAYLHGGMAQRMQYEAFRLGTFLHLLNVPEADAIRLANAGFFFTFYGQVLQCFSCGIQWDGWVSGMDPYEEHRRLSPGCLHMNDGDPSNKPIQDNQVRHRSGRDITGETCAGENVADMCSAVRRSLSTVQSLQESHEDRAGNSVPTTQPGASTRNQGTTKNVTTEQWRTSSLNSLTSRMNNSDQDIDDDGSLSVLESSHSTNGGFSESQQVNVDIGNRNRGPSLRSSNQSQILLSPVHLPRTPSGSAAQASAFVYQVEFPQPDLSDVPRSMTPNQPNSSRLSPPRTVENSNSARRDPPDLGLPVNNDVSPSRSESANSNGRLPAAETARYPSSTANGVPHATLSPNGPTPSPTTQTPATHGTSYSTNGLSERGNTEASASRLPAAGTATMATPDVPNEAAGATGGPVTYDPSRALYPRFSDINARLHSFAPWPAHLPQSPEDLVDSGFFYTGREDCVRCFYCGLGLKHWEADDDPEEEHARWRGSCAYLNFRRNERTNAWRQTLAGSRRQNVSTSQRPREHGHPVGARSSPEHGDCNLPVSTQTARPMPSVFGNRNWMTSTAAETAREMGFDDDVIEQALIGLLSTRAGPRAVTPQNLANAILYMRAQASARQGPEWIHGYGDSSDSDASSDSQEDNASSAAQAPPAEDEAVLGGGSPNPGLGGRDAGRDEATGSLDLTVFGEAHESGGKLRSATVNVKGTNKNEALRSSQKLIKEELQRLEEENKELAERRRCKICLDKDINVLLLPCAHLVCCEDCVLQLRRCPVCRTKIKNVMRTHYG